MKQIRQNKLLLNNSIPDQMIKNCMLFFMRKGILPQWEDPKNCDGGCFSFKINNKQIADVWRKMSKLLTGETLSSHKMLMQTINGITVSPKKSFCILKIWTSTLEFQNIKHITKIDGVSFQGCLFKKHKS